LPDVVAVVGGEDDHWYTVPCSRFDGTVAAIPGQFRQTEVEQDHVNAGLGQSIHRVDQILGPFDTEWVFDILGKTNPYKFSSVWIILDQQNLNGPGDSSDSLWNYISWDNLTYQRGRKISFHVVVSTLSPII